MRRTKKCSKCRKTKSLRAFHKNSHSADGHQSVCKKCKNRRQLKYLRTPRGYAVRQAYLQRLKDQVFDLLGRKCRCGFSDMRALQIDHVNGGGYRESQKRTGTQFYRHVLKNPKDYQTLCANCNWIKRAERGETRSRKIPCH